jgi:hypothetical protein
MFATPVAYLIDEAGVITQDLAVGVEPVLQLMAKAKELSRNEAVVSRCRRCRRLRRSEAPLADSTRPISRCRID